MNDPTPSQQPLVEPATFSKYDEGLLDNLAKDVAAQATRLDELAKQLITLNIAIPGLYATALKLISGDNTTMPDDLLKLLIIFGAWLLALGFAFASLYPLSYHIDPDNISSIENYFQQSAQRKRKWLTAAGLLSFFGICFAVFSLFI